MSYSTYIVKFENNDMVPMSYTEIESILTQHGTIVEGEFGKEFIHNSEEYIFEYCSLEMDEEGKVSGLSFNRPIHHSPFPEFIFDLLAIEGSCFFGTDMEFVLARTDRSLHLPEGFPNEVIVVESPTDRWPLD